MNTPYIWSDECSHEEIELRAQNRTVQNAQWNGGNVTLRRFKAYYEHCADCGERLSHLSHDSKGNIGWEVIESITIPATVVVEYRESE